MIKINLKNETHSEHPNMVITRYQKKRALYEEVMTNPLILSTILPHLGASDGANLMLTCTKYTKSQDLKLEMTNFMKTKEEEYEQKLIEEENDSVFKQLKKLTVKFNPNTELSHASKIKLVKKLYKFILNHKTILQRDVFDAFFTLSKQKLIEFASHFDFADDAVFYLEKIFDIKVYYEPSEDEVDIYGDEVVYTYILDEETNEKIYL